VLPRGWLLSPASKDHICGSCSWLNAKGDQAYRSLFLWELIERGKDILRLAYLWQDPVNIFTDRLKKGKSTERQQREPANGYLYLNVRE
jgi:hypothetical protein